MIDLNFLPTLNAIFNSCALICLISGYIAIKKGLKERHKKLMITALAFSSAFLVSYLTYHYNVGHKVFPDIGIVKTIYLIILIPHVILAALMVPMIIMTFFFAFTEKWEKHKKLARITFPVWVYVSFTGIIIYFMLKAYYF